MKNKIINNKKSPQYHPSARFPCSLRAGWGHFLFHKASPAPPSSPPGGLCWTEGEELRKKYEETKLKEDNCFVHKTKDKETNEQQSTRERHKERNQQTKPNPAIPCSSSRQRERHKLRPSSALPELPSSSCRSSAVSRDFKETSFEEKKDFKETSFEEFFF